MNDAMGTDAESFSVVFIEALNTDPDEEKHVR